jgi:hypothetical protein
MMADAIRMAKSCNFTVFYWAHDIHFWDGTLPFTLYTTDIGSYPCPSPCTLPDIGPRRARQR